MNPARMKRVSKSNPCPACGKPDWCLVAEDGSAAICARIEQGSVKKCGDAGWLHIFRENVPNVPNVHRSLANKQKLVQIVTAQDKQPDDIGLVAEKYHKQLDQGRLSLLAGSLGVSAESLRRLKVGWDGKAYTFPMSTDFGKTIGIRRRFSDGRKVSVTGSRTGLFIPAELSTTGPLLIVEGESDLAAALTLGFESIGRPNCNSKVEITVKAAKGHTEAVIIGDNDPPGRNGAEKLARVLVLHCTSVKIVYPPAQIKDLRQWVQTGLTMEGLQRAIDQSVPIKIKVNFRRPNISMEANKCRK